MGIFDAIKSAIFNDAAAADATASQAISNVTQAASSGTPVDVGAILDKAAAASGQKLNWRSSIVDLMKALNLDSSLASRQQLARELDYPGDTNNSAAMNVWLHSELMKKLEANGGKLPAGL